MSAGITKTLEVISIVQDLSVRLISVAKAKSVFSFFAQAPAIFNDVHELSQDVTLVVPELVDVDAEEVGQLGSAAYGLVTAVVAAIKA